MHHNIEGGTAASGAIPSLKGTALQTSGQRWKIIENTFNMYSG